MARSPAKRFFGSLLFWVAVVAVLAFVFLLYADSINDDDIPFVNDVKAAALVITIALGVIAFGLFLMLVTRRWATQAAAAEEAEVFFLPEPMAAPPAPTTEFDAVPEIMLYDLRKVPPLKRSWSAPEVDGKQHPFYFPRSVTGGIYVNDYIPVDSHGKLLKLRTLLGGPFDIAFADTGSAPTLRRIAPTRSEPVAAQPAAIRPVEAPAGMVLQEVQAESVEPAPEPGVFVDYPGDNHEVEDLEGIGPTYGKRLRDAGVHTTARLAYEDATALANTLQVPKGTVEAWQQMAELVKVKGIGPQYAEALVRAGITGIADLKRRSPAKMADQINAYLDTLDVNVLGNKITEKRVEGWKEAAKSMKRVRLQIPEK
jgi:predicted flap endonuclease-1-like 5' DNA nuclease